MRLAAAAMLVLGVAACRGRAPAPAATTTPPPPAPRTATILSGPWRFSPDAPAGAEAPAFDDRAWEAVTVPHTWGAAARNGAWYRLRFHVGPQDRGRRVFVSFEGVAVYADVYVNGHHLGRHRGAFTRFAFDATDHLTPGENVLAVHADNDPASTVDSLPSGAGRQLYRLYGGIYRKAWLVKTDEVHVDPADDAASGVFVTPTKVTRESADLEVRVRVRNASSRRRAIGVRARLIDRDGLEVRSVQVPISLAAAAGGEARLAARVDRPHLWSPADPYLYRVAVEVREGDLVLDSVAERTGFRDFRMEGGRFLLNGEPIVLRGVGKHQETEARLSAVTDEDLREDFETLADLGVNMVRLAHYPHAPLEYDLADEKGLLVWAENGHSNESKVKEAGDVITRDMVRQNYNHPSIVMWSVGNETGFVRVNGYARIVRQEDPHRLVVYASNTGTRPKKHYPEIDLITQNTYRGWYRGIPWDFEEAALSMRYLSEGGGGAVISNHDEYVDPRHVVDEFEPEEYRQLLEEVRDQVLFRDHPREVPLSLLWVLRDFGTEKYKGVRNTKGLVTYAGFRKDAYYLYRTFLRPEEPLVFLTGKTWFLRRRAGTNGVKAYSNRPELSLVVNGRWRGSRKNGEHHHRNGRQIANVFFWADALGPGRNEVVASDGAGHQDAAVIDYVPPGVPAAEREGALVRDLRSSNAESPAYFIDQPVRAQWPFYSEFDGTADNTFASIPELVQGASWIATPRLSKPAARTEISFSIGAAVPAASVFVIGTESPALARALLSAGFADTGATGRWHDDALQLVGCRVFHRRVRGGERVRIPALTADYVVLVKGGV